MDAISLFGFMTGFFTLVLLGYRNQLRTRLPVIAVGLACCSAYGFLAGAWPMGFVLLAVTAEEFRRWKRASDQNGSSDAAVDHLARSASLPVESRMHRMFGHT